MGEEIRVLHVDDDESFTSLTKEFLEDIDERLAVTTMTKPTNVMDTLSAEAIDCVVSDYDMPDITGLELLKEVRKKHSNLPFILFTGKGSESVAGAAISADVTDYLQKGSATEQYELLANRITNAVTQYQAEQQATMWKQAAETATEGISIVGPDGRYEHLNQAYANVFGTSPEDLIGEPWTVTVPESEVERLRTEVFPSLSDGAWSGASVGQRADGETYPRFLSLATLEDGRHICAIRDLAESSQPNTVIGKDPQRLSATALRRRAQQFDALFRYAPDLVDIHNGDGELIKANQRLCDILDYSKDELLEMRVWEIDKNITETEVREMWDGMEHGDVHQLETEYQCRDGSTISVEVRIVKVKIIDEDRFLAIARDVSEEKAYREQLEARNESLRKFSNIVSHDLRNPLNVAQGRLQLAQEACETEHHDAIGQSLDRMEQLIDDLLVLSHEGAELGEQEVVDLGDLASDCWDIVESDTAQLCVNIDRSVYADRSRLQQVLENLFRNAIEHGGSNVTVTFGELPSGDGFYIEDSGDGIPPEAEDQLFDTGFSTNPDGTGFGLNIAREVVEAHGWDIDTTNGSVSGARFEVYNVSFVST